jgi:hypothetical protein
MARATGRRKWMNESPNCAGHGHAKEPNDEQHYDTNPVHVVSISKGASAYSVWAALEDRFWLVPR